MSVTGDLWLLGDHRLLVGDATVRGDADRLMASDTADLVFTDPPYNVDYEGYTEERLKIKGDRMSDADFRAFLKMVFRSYRRVVKPGASLYICHSSSHFIVRRYFNYWRASRYHSRTYICLCRKCHQRLC